MICSFAKRACMDTSRACPLTYTCFRVYGWYRHFMSEDSLKSTPCPGHFDCSQYPDIPSPEQHTCTEATRVSNKGSKMFSSGKQSAQTEQLHSRWIEIANRAEVCSTKRALKLQIRTGRWHGKLVKNEEPTSFRLQEGNLAALTEASSMNCGDEHSPERPFV